MANTLYPAKKKLTDTGTVRTKRYDAVVVTVSLYKKFVIRLPLHKRRVTYKVVSHIPFFPGCHSSLSLDTKINIMLNTKLRDLVVGTVTTQTGTYVSR
jgi:hypothetical protein